MDQTAEARTGQGTGSGEWRTLDTTTWECLQETEPNEEEPAISIQSQKSERWEIIREI